MGDPCGEIVFLACRIASCTVAGTGPGTRCELAAVCAAGSDQRLRRRNGRAWAAVPCARMGMPFRRRNLCWRLRRWDRVRLHRQGRRESGYDEGSAEPGPPVRLGITPRHQRAPAHAGRPHQGEDRLEQRRRPARRRQRLQESELRKDQEIDIDRGHGRDRRPERARRGTEFFGSGGFT